MVESIRRVRFASHCIASHCVRIGGKSTRLFASLRFAMVEKVHPFWPCEIWQGHTKKCVVGDTKWIRQKHFVHSKGQLVIQFGNVVSL